MSWKVLALGVAIAAGSLTAFEAEAQRLQGAGPPAEIPPPSFQGNQYVDSRGCVFVRAGFQGAESWVPRVGRNRQQICGARPSLGPAEAAAQTAVRAAPVPVMPAPPQRVVRAPGSRAAAPERRVAGGRAPAPPAAGERA